MDILLIRHGEAQPKPTAGGESWEAYPDPDLTEPGIEQARCLAEHLAGWSIDLLYTSDLIRALHTAQVLNERLHLPLVIRPSLREIHMGKLHQLSWEDIRQQDPSYAADWLAHTSDLPYPGGECGEDVRRRVMPVIEEILSTPARQVAVVTHGGVIRTLVCAVLGIELYKRFYLGSPLENCNLTMLHWGADERRFYLNSFNDSGNLYNKRVIV